MAKPYNDKKFGLGEPIAGMLMDFCTANYGAPALNVIREAVRTHIETRLHERSLRERYERAREERLSRSIKVLQLVKKNTV